MARPISRVEPSSRSVENVQTTFLLPAIDRKRLLFAASVNNVSPSEYLRRAVLSALAGEPALKG